MTDAEREFLDRYLTDDRVVGVRFAASMIEVQVIRNRGEVDLPEAFGGTPVVVRDFPETPDPAAGNADLGGDGPPAPSRTYSSGSAVKLADCLRFMTPRTSGVCA